MVGIRELRTQTETFWRDEYQVSEVDLDLIAGLVLDTGTPQRVDTMASSIILRRLCQEKKIVTQQASQGQVYRPSDSYEAGQQLVFSALDFVVGRVVDVRPGHNPKYGAFDVIRVALEPSPLETGTAGGAQAAEREFAASYDHPHPLNRPVEELLSGGGGEMSEAEVVKRFEHYVASKLEAALEAHKDFVWFNSSWFLAALLPEIHIGYLNLAEAVIYEAGHPLAAREMLGELDLETTSSVDAQLFALNHALGEDERFDNVSLAEEPVWYLRALQPEAAFHTPAVLKEAFRAVGGEYLGLTMLDMIDELGDELDDVETMMTREMSGIHFVVNFPHLYAGSMPATLQFLRAHVLRTHPEVRTLPPVSGRRFPMTMIDARTEQRFEVWALPKEHYVCGLGDWYASAGMCVGGQVSIRATDEPLTFSISMTPTRSRRSEWVRSASAVEGRLVLQMQRTTIAVRCDRNVFVDVSDREAIAHLMAQTEEAQVPLRTLVRAAFEELAKLSSGGVVHAKSIYSIINLMRRTGAVSVFAELTRNACFDPVGDGFWAYDPDLKGKHYRTPEEMRERPLSNRGDVVVDQVVQYLGR